MRRSQSQNAYSTAKPSTQRDRSWRQLWDRLVRKHLWRMDIADDAWIAPSAYIDRTYPAGIRIESGVVIEDEASILTHDMTRGVYRDTTLGKNTIVGARAIVMPGVSVGEDSIIDPGSVVTKDAPAGSHLRGNPACPIVGTS